MSNPYIPYLVYGTVTNSSNEAAETAEVVLITGFGRTKVYTNSNGQYVADLANAGYEDGDTVTVQVESVYNNEVYNSTFIAEDDNTVLNASLSTRSIGCATQNGFIARAMLHNIGGCPVTKENPLPMEPQGVSPDFDLVNNPGNEWLITESDGQPDSETMTLNDGSVYIRTFTYDTISGMRVLIARSAWQKQ